MHDSYLFMKLDAIDFVTIRSFLCNQFGAHIKIVYTLCMNNRVGKYDSREFHYGK